MQRREHTVGMQIYVTEPNRNTHIYFFSNYGIHFNIVSEQGRGKGIEKTGSDYFDVNY